MFQLFLLVSILVVFYILSQNGTLRHLSVLNLKSVSNLTTFSHFYHFYSDLIYHHLMLTLLQKPLTRITAFTLVFQAAFSQHVGQTDLVKTQIRSWRFLAQYSPKNPHPKSKSFEVPSRAFHGVSSFSPALHCVHAALVTPPACCALNRSVVFSLWRLCNGCACSLNLPACRSLHDYPHISFKV